MATEAEYRRRIQTLDREGLLNLWDQIRGRTTGETNWAPGKAFEYLILRAFEIEGADVVWPYSVDVDGDVVEQIDGAIHFDGLSVICESKDYSRAIAIEPIAKLRNQLARRPAATIGSVFVSTTFTVPAITLAAFSAPQTILLWTGEQIGYALTEGNFRDWLRRKYRDAVENGYPSLTNYQNVSDVT
ncbi:restriction endonuclease [Stratiformator vulcanicus]|uniref:Restriction endonuclease type IV Mrr domain-containing protein n=1 Tax=Stratiformator vulcanicus TaxID=2527980 RepID=A0A517R3S1_9PLAN|nr:restriction endonuclease [Stratiformator vulcanicus]QDT38483.1 hypothetical protein Pan189_28770 [Stratiformator vulcanicus]